MKYKMCSILMICVELMLFQSNDMLNVKASNETINNSKFICQASVLDDFEDNSIIVVVNQKPNTKHYVSSDFEEIGCILVEEKLSISSQEYSILKLTLEQNDKENVLNSIKLLEQREDVISAEPNYKVFFSSDMEEPNDELYDLSWWAEVIEAPQAWNITTGSSSVKVGVVDTGISYLHPDLIGKVDTTLSKSFCNIETSPLEDASGHGTAVAGIIGANANNEIGIQGICWNVSLVSLKVGTGVSGDELYLDKIIEVMEYSRINNIEILNMSFVFSRPDISSYYYAVNSYPGLIVCGAGNDGMNIESSLYIPATLPNSNIITVGASTIDYNTMIESPKNDSNFGSTSVDLFAPGMGILTTSMCDENCIGCVWPNYHFHEQTSFATPFVTGTAALIKSINPNLTSDEIKERILNNVDIPLGSNNEPVFENLCSTGGRLNIFKAVHPTHNYTGNYLWVNLANHKSNCICGEYKLLPHAVLEGSYENGVTIATCYVCGGDAQIGFDIWPNNYQRKVTNNGSYILPNGVIILVEEDVELFMQGKLTFNNNPSQLI